MKRIALTGGIATGKSHVRGLFAALGVPTIDSDTLARDVVAVGTPALAAVIERFGERVLGPGGSLDRKALGAIVFADPAARRDLEAIIHPAVRAETERWFAALDAATLPFAIADIPLLYEVGRDRDFDEVIVVGCDPATQLQRVVRRDGISRREAQLRIDAQLPIAEKEGRADYVIRTDGSIDETDAQVMDLYRRLRS